MNVRKPEAFWGQQPLCMRRCTRCERLGLPHLQHRPVPLLSADFTLFQRDVAPEVEAILENLRPSRQVLFAAWRNQRKQNKIN